jgi:hypothetical protein
MSSLPPWIRRSFAAKIIRASLGGWKGMTNGRKTSCIATGALAAGFAVLFLSCAAAQEANAPPPAKQAPAASYKPGMLESVGRWFSNSYNRVGTQAQGAREAAKGAADAAKGAADAVARWPKSHVVSARKRCDTAPNGAPDCRAAAVNVCKAKGFASGASLDIQSARKCPARVWLSGRAPDPDECEAEAFVTRAVCQ